MNGAINPAAAKQGRIGSVYYRVYVLASYVADFDGNAAVQEIVDVHNQGIAFKKSE
jgi:hypothetical protein